MIRRFLRPAPLAAAALLGLALAPAAGGANLNQLSSELSASRARAQSLAASLRGLSTEIATLSGQITAVQSRAAEVQGALASDRVRLAAARAEVGREQRLLARLGQQLARARMILARQLVAGYESSRPDLMTVILDATGFNQLLEQITFLSRAQRQQQSAIRLTRQAKQAAQAATIRLRSLERTDAQITQATGLEARALAGMNLLLQSRQTALGHARAAQQAALGAARARGTALTRAIARVKAQQAAAARAAALQAAQAGATTLVPSGGWAIPYSIVLCESGGQNLPPNSAGASGYYQIIPSTWRLFGGSGPAAYLAPKAEQDAVASRIWDGGRGASNWACAAILAIH